ncbi:MAG: glutamyl-tRNA reductase, partial [Campylobacter concisus]|nr:glutamyl-tRNA reductase [Campylobacter concisus]
MHYLDISFTYKNTDISVREKLAFDSDDKKEQILKLINSNKNIKESMVLNTCNRVEIIA